MDRIRIIELFSKDKQIELIHLHINILIPFVLNSNMKNITLRALLPFIGFVILCSCSNHKTADGDAQIISLKNGHHRLINNRFSNGKWIMGIDYMDDTCIYSFENDYSYLDLLYEDSLLDEESRRILKTVNDDTNGLIIKYHLRNDILN